MKWKNENKKWNKLLHVYFDVVGSLKIRNTVQDFLRVLYEKKISKIPHDSFNWNLDDTFLNERDANRNETN